MNGPIALVGSGEFLPVMEDVDRTLLEGRPARVVFLPTAAAPEGDERIQFWVQLGHEHYARMGVESEALMVLERADAERPDFAERIAGAGLVYLSGGNPAFLTDTLRDSAVWHAIETEWRKGAALAGCSAGAIALSAVVRDRFAADAPIRPALRVVPHLAILPHFDRLIRFRPELARRPTPDGVTLVGVDEDTAIVGGPRRWTVMGRQRAWILHPDAEREGFDAGDVIETQ